MTHDATCWWTMGILFVVGGCAVSPKTPKLATSPETAPAVEKQIEAADERREAAELEVALTRWKAGDEAGCEELLRHALRANPRQKAARLMLADLCSSQGRLDEAVTHLQQLLRQDPNNPQYHHSLGLVFEAQGRRSEALQCYSEATRLQPDNALYQLCRECALADLQTVRTGTPVLP